MSKLITISPCIRVCKLDEKSVCTGCDRHISEIGEWSKMDDGAKHKWWMDRKKSGTLDNEKNQDKHQTL